MDMMTRTWNLPIGSKPTKRNLNQNGCTYFITPWTSFPETGYWSWALTWHRRVGYLVRMVFVDLPLWISMDGYYGWRVTASEGRHFQNSIGRKRNHVAWLVTTAEPGPRMLQCPGRWWWGRPTKSQYSRIRGESWGERTQNLRSRYHCSIENETSKYRNRRKAEVCKAWGLLGWCHSGKCHRVTSGISRFIPKKITELKGILGD